MRIAAIIGIVFCSGLTRAGAEHANHSTTIDVTISQSGDFVSQCQDSAGHGVAGADVSLYQSGKRFAATVSGRDGWFTINGVRPGLYQLKSGEWQNPVRVWSPDSAPPGAGDPIALILDDPLPKTSVLSASQIAAAGAASAHQLQKSQEHAASAQAVSTASQVAVEPAAFASPAISAAVATVDAPVIELVSAPKSLTKPAAEHETSNPFAHAPLPVEAPAPAPPLPVAVDPQATALEPATAALPSPTETAIVADADFDPFYQPTSLQTEPPAEMTEEEIAPAPLMEETAPAAVPEFPGGDAQGYGAGPVASQPPAPGGSPPSMGCPPVGYQSGPTIGDVVIASTVLGGIAVGVVAIDRYDHRRVRTIVSP